ncbi:uncharacterized protein LOC110990688 [Acanthaster planci]|uniref:Uncharacterized protein LOC110990688 n=1 Tax=Acanthaster planci TaxID=133434 RepID=A0A8B8A152_ACAPL|nr:uncharacterized protein LOC110990688 [Acanthaster planci]
MSPDHLRNPEIGRVRDDQAVVGAVVEFTPYPFLTAQYVSVDIPRSGEVDGVQTIVQLTEVMVEEVVMETEMDSKSAVLEALNSTNRTISQSSTYNQSGDERVASRAFDGASYYGNPHCSQTNEEPNPWWKIDLGSACCISKITIRNIDDLRHYTRLNLTGAVARAGLSATPTDNAMCGSPVTQYQALINDRIDIHCEPTKLARYVSVDIPRRSFLILCEVKVWSCELQPPALTLTDNPIFQSSVLSGHDADRALDGLPEDPFCSLTNKEENPWWRVDLQSDNCLGIIRVRNTGSPSEQNLLSAVARAGLSEVPTDNIMCGTPVTSDQSTINDWIEFACDLPVLARYVSVDIPGIGSLKLCEVTVSACNLQLKHNAADFTLIVNPALLGVSGDDSACITAYKDADDVTAGVTFGRRLPTGENSNDLPSGAVVLADPSTGCADKFVLRLPEEGGLKRTGVFYSERIKNDIRIRIETIILPKDDSYVHIRPAQPTQTASIGDNVKLEMHNVNSPNIYYRWRHNGGDIIVSWNDRLTVAIPAATKENEGVYTCFSSGQEDKQLHGITKLIVRGCVAERWGTPLCLATCRRCYNGGVCDEKSGMCVCAPGFSGDNCEQGIRKV